MYIYDYYFLGSKQVGFKIKPKAMMSTESKRKLAIVGWRNYRLEQEFEAVVDSWIEQNGPIDEIISGACAGVDTLAKNYAKRNSIAFVEFPPNKALYGSLAFRRRNEQIVAACTHVLALPHKTKSRGTRMTINIARKAGKIVSVFEVS